MIRRPPRSTLDRSSAASDVYKRQLDRCFSNHWRKFFIEDLINACNQAIYDFSGIENGVKKRQVFDDITFMESEQGWAIPLLSLIHISEPTRPY